MKAAQDLLPWKVTDISLRPYSHFWSFNPSIHYDGATWRCVLRCADYCMEGGKTTRSKKARPGEALTKNAMVIFDASSWRPLEIYKIKERDGLRRAACSSVGYEDVRLFRTDAGGLQGIAASLHLWRDQSSRKPRAEQVLISFDENYDVVAAAPLRGSWSTEPQKNWSPFDHSTEPRFLITIDEGRLLGPGGALGLDEARVLPGVVRSPYRNPPPEKQRRAQRRARKVVQEKEERRDSNSRGHRSFSSSDDLLTGATPLRGGTQLVRLGPDAWLGIGHAMKFVGGSKCYHHVWYVVDDCGRRTMTSPPMKLAPDRGIEFAAGLAIDEARVVVSFGVDDAESKIAETSLSAVKALLQ
jgi:hypothetical protein